MSRKLFGRGGMVPRVGHLVGYMPGGDHGCRDGFVGEIVEMREYDEEEIVAVKVQEGTVTTCHSCWQVGHDAYHVIATEGQLVGFSVADLKLNDREYKKEVLWTCQYVHYCI